MTECNCGYADECDGTTAVFLPLGHGGDIACRPCRGNSGPAPSQQNWEQEYWKEESQYYGTD